VAVLYTVLFALHDTNGNNKLVAKYLLTTFFPYMLLTKSCDLQFYIER